DIAGNPNVVTKPFPDLTDKFGDIRLIVDNQHTTLRHEDSSPF
ncbi:MAG: hypothetical protein ACI9MJ_001487, partial [Alphaproteobacteria bacterium]